MNQIKQCVFLSKLPSFLFYLLLQPFLFLSFAACENSVSYNDISGTWKIELYTSNGKEETASYSTSINDETIEYIKYWRITEDTLYYVYEITSEIEQEKLVAISEGWYEQFGIYLNANKFAFETVSIEIDDDLIWMDSDYERYSLEGSTLKIGNSTNYIQLRKSDKDLDSEINNFEPLYEKEPEYTELALDTQTPLSINDNGFAYMQIKLEAGTTYYFSSKEANLSSFKIFYSQTTDFNENSYMNNLYEHETPYPITYFISNLSGVYYFKVSDINSAASEIKITMSKTDPLSEPNFIDLTLDNKAEIEVDESGTAFMQIYLETGNKYFFSSQDANSSTFKIYFSNTTEFNENNCLNNLYDYDISYPVTYFTPDVSGMYFFKLSDSNSATKSITIIVSKNDPQPKSTPITVGTSETTPFSNTTDYYYFSAELIKDEKYYIYNYDAYLIHVTDSNNANITLYAATRNLTTCLNHPYCFTAKSTGTYYIMLALSSSEDAKAFGLDTTVDLSLSAKFPNEAQDYKLGDSISIPSSKRLVLSYDLTASDEFFYYTDTTTGGSDFDLYVYEDHSQNNYTYALKPNRAIINEDTMTVAYWIMKAATTQAAITGPSYIVAEFYNYNETDTFTVSDTDPLTSSTP